jgi:hypothetical protein
MKWSVYWLQNDHVLIVPEGATRPTIHQTISFTHVQGDSVANTVKRLRALADDLARNFPAEEEG